MIWYEFWMKLFKQLIILCRWQLREIHDSAKNTHTQKHCTPTSMQTLRQVWCTIFSKCLMNGNIHKDKIADWIYWNRSSPQRQHTESQLPIISHYLQVLVKDHIPKSCFLMYISTVIKRQSKIVRSHNYPLFLSLLHFLWPCRLLFHWWT